MCPSVKTLIGEALANRVQVVVYNISLERAVTVIVHTMLKSDRAHAMKIIAGDVVSNKKSHPAIYELTAAALNVRLDQSVVNEDS